MLKLVNRASEHLARKVPRRVVTMTGSLLFLNCRALGQDNLHV